jgi:spermidine synthase
MTTRPIPFLAGFTAAVGQIVLMREVVVLFNGNELSLAVVLAAWLLWTAAGSCAAGRLMRRRGSVRHALAVVECLCGLSLPLALCALRYARAGLQSVPGELLGPVSVTVVCLLCLSAFCVLSGGIFALAAQRMNQEPAVSSSLSSSFTYLLETAGFATGGLATSILLRVLGCMQIAALAALICEGVGVILLVRQRHRQIPALAGIVLAAIPLLAYFAPRVDTSTQQRLWPGFDLLASRDSMYGRLTVIGAGGMRSIYDNGSILANVPDVASAEVSVHYAMLEHVAPRRVLLIGNGINGSIAEILKHPTLQRLDYVELDPALVAMYRQLFPREAAQAFSDSRVHVHEMDGRLYLQTVDDSFDVILVNVPDPVNAQLNRFYTAEFFGIAKRRLAPGGLLALKLRSSEESVSPALATFLRCIGQTLDSVFPRVVAIPGETFHFFASADSTALTEDPQVLVARLKSRNLQTLYVREYFVPFGMMPDRMAQVHELLEADNATAINRDFYPVAYYFTSVLWSSQFGHGYARLLENAKGIRFSYVLAAVIAFPVAFVAILALGATPGKRRRAAAVWCVAANGYTLMALQILLLLAFQSVFGYVYRELALLIGMFMAGIAAGSWLGIRYASGRASRSLLRAAAIDQIVLAASAPLLLGVVGLFALQLHAGAFAVARAAFPLVALLCAIPGGFQFPIASAIYLEGRSKETNLATLYAVDLTGGCVGALGLAGFLIPVFGFWMVAWLAAAIGMAPAALAAAASFQPCDGQANIVHSAISN